MVKINENEVIISRHELFVLTGAAAASHIKDTQMIRRAPRLAEFSVNFAERINQLTEGHIWEDEALPPLHINFLANLITPEDADGEDARRECYEDKQSICMLLLATLQKTRAFHDLIGLRYDPCNGATIADFESGGRRQINTMGDSGIAMIKDILAHL